MEIDEQLDRSNSQTSMELCHACDEKFFWGVQPSSPSTKEFHGEGSLQRDETSPSETNSPSRYSSSNNMILICMNAAVDLF